MTFEFFREINIVLAGIASFWLGWRTAGDWSAEWAKPDHVLHYRSVLVLLGLTYAVIGLGSYWHEEQQTEAGITSVFVTALAAAVIVLCWRWPHPRPFRREE